MKVTNVYTINPSNIGDMTSTPMLYFSFPFDLEPAHILDHPKGEVGNVLFGGGGLLHCREEMTRYITAARGKLITWGIGHNTHGGSQLDWPPLMDRFALHGVRDWGTPYPWVPCVSCMHPAFDQPHRISREVVVYEHQHHPTRVEGFQTLTNIQATMADVVGFLGSAETIITSSYHGAYWGVLLGRRVLVVNPFSTKFRHFKHQPEITTPARWQRDRKEAPVFPNALEECREANRRHYQRVLEVFG